MPTTDNSVSRRVLIKSKSEFYVQYNANYEEQEKAIVALTGSTAKLNDFKERIKKAELEDLIFLSSELRKHLDDELTLALTKYELLVINPLNKFTKVLKMLLNTREVGVAFRVRELEEYKNLVRLVEGKSKEFYEISERILFLTSSFDSKKIKKLPIEYGKLVESLRPLIIRACEVISELTSQIEILDAKTKRVLDKIA